MTKSEYTSFSDSLYWLDLRPTAELSYSRFFVWQGTEVAWRSDPGSYNGLSDGTWRESLRPQSLNPDLTYDTSGTRAGPVEKER